MNKKKILMDQFDVACRNMEVLGAYRKEEHSEIVDQYNKAKKNLSDYIDGLLSLIQN